MDLPTQSLPVPLPVNPFELLSQWLDQALADAAQPNPNSMVLATVDREGRPSARVVLCKEILVDEGAVVFYTNYESRKAQELAQTGRAALVFHWDHRHRQCRVEGSVARVGSEKSDAYFASRPWQSKLGAWASRQSEPTSSIEAIAAELAAVARRFGLDYAGPGAPEPDRVTVDIPRPERWGGYSLTATAIELWVEGRFRIHERVRWTRSTPGEAWTPVRLQP